MLFPFFCLIKYIFNSLMQSRKAPAQELKSSPLLQKSLRQRPLLGTPAILLPFVDLKSHSARSEWPPNSWGTGWMERCPLPGRELEHSTRHCSTLYPGGLSSGQSGVTQRATHQPDCTGPAGESAGLVTQGIWALHGSLLDINILQEATVQ